MYIYHNANISPLYCRIIVRRETSLMTRSVHMSVGLSVIIYVKVSIKGGKFHLHAPFGELDWKYIHRVHRYVRFVLCKFALFIQ